VLFWFGDYRLDTDRRELRRGDQLISLGPQVFDLLVFLVQNRNRVVGKDDLFDAVWSGRIVSESTLTTHINAVRRSVGDSGEDQRLIRTIPRKGFRFVGEVKEEQTHGERKSAAAALTEGDEAKRASPLSLPNEPSIAVLPFQNLSGDPEQEYFADGIVEDIIMALSRMRWLFVIARNSSFTYKGRAVDVKQVGRDLGVRYVLEGSVRKAANRVRIAGQLIDASTGAHLWADRFDGSLEDVFGLQDQVAGSVVGAIVRSLEQAEIERTKRKTMESLDAYDYFLRGMASFYRRTNEANSEALRQFSKAIESDPDFASAYGMAAWCYVWRKLNRWMLDPAQETNEAVRLARLAVELGADDAVALTRGGHALAILVGDLDQGIAALDRALTLNPNQATAWYLSGWLRNFLGKPDIAIEHLARAMRLSPLDPALHNMQTGTAFAHLLAGRYDEASLWVEQAFRNDVKYLHAATVTAASHALGGRLEEARQAMERVRQIDPSLRISNLKDWLPLRGPENLARWADGLQKAGLPE
jgi:TolB-like protein